MAKRKYKLAELTDAQMKALAEAYPKAVRTVTTRRLDYRICAMLIDCGAKLPEGVALVEEVPAESKKELEDIVAFQKKTKKLGLAAEQS